MILRTVRCAAAMLRRVELMVFGGFLVLGESHTAGAQQRTVTSRPTEAAIAFVNVNAIPMDSERMESGQTVIVRSDRIAAIGASTEVPVPRGATVRPVSRAWPDGRARSPGWRRNKR